MTLEADNLKYALAYAKLGWQVLPLHYPTDKNRCSCRKADCDRVAKHPMWDQELLPHGVKSASTDPTIIKKWWSKWPKANIGVATGSGSGIVAIDIDPRHSGDVSLKELYGTHQYESRTTRAVTGGGGFHEIFAYPRVNGNAIRNKGGVGGLSGLDVRSDGGLIVVPPSQHATGRRYAWESNPLQCQPAVLPEWLYTTLVGRPGKSNGVNDKYDWDTVFDGVADGNRDNTLFRYACYLRNLNLGRRQVEALVLKAAAACPNPFPAEKALIKVDQAFKYNPADSRDVVLDVDPGVRAIRVTNFTLWAKRNTQDVSWLVDEWIPRRSTGLVVGKSGSFKSYLTLHMLSCVASGNAFLGKYPVNVTGKVVLFQQEDAAMTTIKRMAAILGVGPVKDLKPEGWEVPVPDRLNDNLYIEEEHLLNFENPMAMGELETYVGDVKPLVVVMDPLNSLASAKDFMSGAPERMRLLKRLRDRFGTTFVIVHHTNKGSANAGWESVWGSQFLVGWKEFGWHLQKVKSESAVLIDRYTKDNAEPQKIRVDLEFQDYGVKFRSSSVESDQVFLLEGEQPTSNHKDSRKEVVLELRGQGMSLREIERRTGVSARTIARYIKEAEGGDV